MTFKKFLTKVGLRKPDVTISARILHADGSVTELGEISKGVLTYEASKEK